MYDQKLEEAKQDQVIIGIDWADQKHDLCIWKNGEESFQVLPNKAIEINSFL